MHSTTFHYSATRYDGVAGRTTNKCELFWYRMGLSATLRGWLVQRRLNRNVGSVDRLENENDWLQGMVCSPGVCSQNEGGAKRVTSGGGGEKEDTETITRSDIPRRTMRCNSLYPVEGEPPPILATKRRRLNSHDRSHYLLPRSL